MKKVSLTITFLMLVSLFATSTTSAETSIQPDYQWVQFGGNDTVIVRTIFKTPAQDCSSVKVSIIDKMGAKTSMPLKSRITPTTGSTKVPLMPDDFDITVCEVVIKSPGKLQSATLGGKKLSLPTNSPQRITVIGDTGCRLSNYMQQNCLNNPEVSSDVAEKWLFTTTIDSAINPKHSLRSDLVIHVGDYIYREAPCRDSKLCEGSPYGPKWATWEADFFAPAAPLLESVPWVFARGNHESCHREWRGWFLFLDPHPLTSDSWRRCTQEQRRSAPYQVSFDGLDLLIMDSARNVYLPDYQETFNMHTGSSPAWLISHRPQWVVGSDFAAKAPHGFNDAAKSANVKLLVSGHTHLFEMIQFDDGRAPQMIAGGGATELDDPVTPEYFSRKLQEFNANESKSEVLHKFTFSQVEVKNDSWHISVIDEDGTTEKKKFVIKSK